MPVWPTAPRPRLALAVTTGLIAGAIWRARRHVERVVQAEARTRNLGRYFSPEVAARLAENAGAPGTGKVHDAAVLFVDVIGSSRRMEGVAPERVIDAVRAYHARVVPIVFRHGGSIDKFLGDGIMAYFGAPVPQEDHAFRAVSCAVEMYAALAKLNEERTRRGEPSLRMGIGIHTGLAVVGDIGAPHRREYTGIGDTVNLAARLTSHAGPGEAWVNEANARRVGAEVTSEARW